jgi:predicted RND superfamily exporter protein
VERIARFIVKRSKLILVMTALLSLLSVLMLFRMSFNADVSSFLLSGNATGEEFIALQEKYEATDPINVVASLPEGATFFEGENLALLIELRDELLAVDGVTAVASVVPEVNPITGEPIDAAMVAALPSPAIEGFVAQSPVSVLLLSDDAQHALLMVTPGDDPTSVARRVDNVGVTGLDLAFSGNPVVFASVVDQLSWFLLIIPPIVILLLLGTFYATIGDRRLSALSILPSVLGSLWTFGVIFAFGNRIDIVTVIVPIFVIVMGSADGLHFVTHFQEQADTTDDPVVAVSSALSEVGVPMILTTVSTAAGFLSLLATDVQPIRQLGLFTAIGIVFAGVVSFFSLPALISRLTIEPKHHSALLGPRITAGLKRLVATRRPAIVLVGAIGVFALLSVPQLEVNPDQLFFFKDDDPVRVAFQKTEDLFGGATPLAGEFAFDPARPEESLVAVTAVSRELEGLDGVRVVFSVVDVAPALSPEQLVGVLRGDVDLPVGRMVSDDGLRFMLLPQDFTTDDLRNWLEYAEATPEIRVLTGMPVVWDEIARLVLQAQATSLIVAFALVTLMLLIAYRNLRETLIALVPIALTIVTLLGFIAISGIQLNLLTAVVSSIVIGVGIDYAIHYIAAINHARATGPGYVFRAIDKAGRPIVANALGIAIALSALWLSPLKIHAQVSMIMWVAMITAALTSLLVIPALLPRSGVEQPVPAVPPDARSVGNSSP